MRYFGLNRTLCDTLEDMRRLMKQPIRSDALISSLIEEAQVMANRMEGALYDVKDMEHLHSEIKRLKLIYEDLKNKTGDTEDG